MTGHPKIPLSRCACGRPMRRRDAVSCWVCLDKELHRRHRRGQGKKQARRTIPRHVPSSIYVQHDAIAKRYQWASVIQRTSPVIGSGA